MYHFDNQYNQSFQYMVEILELSVLLGDLSEMPSVNDTYPYTQAYTTAGGTYIPKGWSGRPKNDGWHWYAMALDQGGYGESELARFWFNNRWRGVVELIHYDGSRGWVISNYYVYTWHSGWGHHDHVHTAMYLNDARRWRDELQQRWLLTLKVPAPEPILGVFVA